MNAFTHAVFYTLLLGASIISSFFSINREPASFSNSFAELAELETMAETPPLEEQKMKTPNKAEYVTDKSTVKLYINNEGVREIGLEEYVTGVLLAEMPSWYSEEALRAAAVAVRTYTLYKINSSNSSKHVGGADLCDSFSHCQAFYTVERASEVWSEESADSALNKMRSAVQATEGEILLYEGEPILAVYHASSYLYTRSSLEVFGGEIPYLQSVSVPFEDRDNSRYNEKSLSLYELCNALSCEPSADIEALWERSRCVGLRVGGERFEASKVRMALGLASANFEVSVDGESIVFKTYGYGHGVGLSQSGAGILAERGWKYDEILSHYYKDTKIAILKINE